MIIITIICIDFILTQVAAVLTDGDTADSDAFIAQVESILIFKMPCILQICPCKNVSKTKREDAFIAQGELEMKKGSDGKKSLYFFDRFVNHF